MTKDDGTIAIKSISTDWVLCPENQRSKQAGTEDQYGAMKGTAAKMAEITEGI